MAGTSTKKQEISLFYAAKVSPLLDGKTFARAYALVSPERRRKVDALAFQKDQCLSLAAELLLRRALEDAGIPALPQIRYSAQKKPYFADGPCFNLSHSGAYAVCALADEAVGCDIEEIRPYPEKLPNHVLHPREQEVLCAAPTAERNALFFRYWTLKESYAKATGMGLSLPLRSLCFDLRQLPARLEGSDRLFREYDHIPGYCCALCRQSGTTPPLRLFSIEQLL